MRKNNAKAEFEQQRRDFLLANFRAAITAQSKISLDNVFRDVAEAPPPRFWVSEARAAAVIGKMCAGIDPTASMFPKKREMFREIFARFRRIKAMHPARSIADIAFEIVNGPAPSSYISCQRARIIIYKELARIRRERRVKA